MNLRWARRKRKRTGIGGYFRNRQLVRSLAGRAESSVIVEESGKRIDAHLKDTNVVFTDTMRAHLEECQERIAKVLNASMQVNE